MMMPSVLSSALFLLMGLVSWCLQLRMAVAEFPFTLMPSFCHLKLFHVIVMERLISYTFNFQIENAEVWREIFKLCKNWTKFVYNQTNKEGIGVTIRMFEMIKFSCSYLKVPCTRFELEHISNN